MEKNYLRHLLLYLLSIINNINPYLSGQNRQTNSLKECVFVNSALKIQSAIVPTGIECISCLIRT